MFSSQMSSIKGTSAHVVLEGNICAGKSTICNHLREVLGEDAVVQSELTESNFLSAFYGDMPRFAFSFQMYMLTTRLHQVLSALISSNAHRHRLNVFFSLVGYAGATSGRYWEMCPYGSRHPR